jgi:hypothetical protein
VKALIVMGVAATAVALGPVLNNAIGGIDVDISTRSLHRLVMPFRSESYRDGYYQVHDRRNDASDKDISTLRKVDASGLASPTDMCRVGMNRLQINPASISDWLSGCADALHDDLGL